MQSPCFSSPDSFLLQVAEARAALAYGSPRQLPKGVRPALPSPPTFAAAGVVGNSAAQNAAAQVVSDITRPLSVAQAAVAAAATREKARSVHNLHCHLEKAWAPWSA